jgi:IS30 family transposase
MSGKHLTLEERYLIQAGVLGELKPSHIARQLRRDISTIRDEIKRGLDKRGQYCPHIAQGKREAAAQRSAANVKRKPEEAWEEVHRLLKKGWSPERICGRWKLIGYSWQISVPALYAGIERRGWLHLLRRRRQRRYLKQSARRAWAGSARPIHERGEDANLRIEIGHWEADTMIGCKKDKRRVLHMVERISLYWELALLRGAHSIPAAKAIKKRLSNNGIAFKTVATDRGPEFTACGTILGDKALACDAYSPNQRATNENQIGALRVDLPKGCSLDSLTPKQLRHLQETYNNMPRKCLGFRTPFEVAFNRQPRAGTRT